MSTTSQPTTSPYLLQPLRTYDEALADYRADRLRRLRQLGRVSDAIYAEIARDAMERRAAANTKW